MALGGISIEFCDQGQPLDGMLERWGRKDFGAYWVDNGDGKLDFEMLAGGKKSKLRTNRGPLWVDLLERASDLNIQEVAYAKESP